MSGISFTGIGSNLPVNDIVQAFVEAERVPYQQRVNQKGAALTTDISANGQLKAVLSGLASSLDKLKDEDNYQLRSASGSDEFVSIDSDKTAQPGSYDIKVNNLAQAHKVISTSFDDETPVGEGQLTFASTNNTDGFTIDVSDTDTLSDVRDKINEASANEDVTATIITSDDGSKSLVMTANKTGVDNEMIITATQADGTTPLDPTSDLNKLVTTGVVPSTLSEINSALDASITIDGQITLTNENNTFEDAIDGITLTAKKAQDVDDDNSNVSVKEDNSLVEKELAKFVEAYNEYYTSAKQLGQSGEDGTGALAGDAMLRGVTSKLRSTLSQSFAAGSETLALSQLGIEADQYGKLSLDKDVLKDKIKEDPQAIQEFFVGTEDKPGFAASTDALIKTYTDKDGIIDKRIEGFEGQLDRLQEDMTNFNRKMERYEARLLSQYNAMDLLVSNLTQSTSGALASLKNLSRSNSNN